MRLVEEEHADGQRDQYLAVQALPRLEGLPVHDADVIEPGAGDLADTGGGDIPEHRRHCIASEHPSSQLFKCLVQHRRSQAFVGHRVHIARAQGQAVLRTIGQILMATGTSRSLHHLLEQARLLGVFLAEVGRVRPNDVEQLEHDGGHPAEVAGCDAPHEHVLQLGHLDVGLKPGGVHVGRQGMKHQVDALAAAHARSGANGRGTRQVLVAGRTASG